MRDTPGFNRTAAELSLLGHGALAAAALASKKEMPWSSAKEPELDPRQMEPATDTIKPISIKNLDITPSKTNYSLVPESDNDQLSILKNSLKRLV